MAAACAVDVGCFCISATVTVTDFTVTQTYPDVSQKGSSLGAASMRIRTLQQANPNAAASVCAMYAGGLLRGSL
jgi:hypothetical protein